jgi:NDP-sugar pyrophosphorylase family protein
MTAPGLPCVCILAGGRGTRLGPLGDETPKPLITVAGRPFLVHQLALLAGHGATRVVLCVGFLGQQIEDALGSRFGDIALQYSYDGPALAGTLGAIRHALPLLGDRFLVLYGDTYLRIDYRGFASAWRASECPGGMAVLRNAGRWDTSNAVFRAGRVVRYDKFAPTVEMDWIDYGLGGLTASAVARVGAGETDLAVLYGALAQRGELFGFPATKRFYEIGTPAALRETERYLSVSHRD